MTTTTLQPAAARAHARPWWRRALLTREMATVAALLLVYVVASTTVTGFSGPLTVTYLVLDVTPILLIALAMTPIIVTGEIDLSVASVVGLVSVTFGVLLEAGLPAALAAVLGVVVGGVCGLVNGLLVAVVGLPSLAVTIGTLALFRGLAVGLLGTRAVTSFPESWTGAVRSTLGETRFPTVTLGLVVAIAVAAVVLHATAFGRDVFDIGRSPETARFSGVPVRRTKVVLFAVSGLVAGLAGIYWSLRYSSARGDNATGLELQVVAAVLLGGVSIFGGRGAVHGVVAGVLLIGVLSSALRLQGVTVNLINIVIGALLVLSVVTPRILAHLSDRRARSSTPRR
ncbi:Monosaccharide-transporting ATPase [Xylanimonas cellulosilytica DSM 15894]|uniref:Autoinducer 2 import system permease protein LsrD n=1 Tax=Xylanimonas cellulosilytica (strain DSM 15894 / JCM 12276 / CECT 5975 / KCTC 9989 / LMG 20990 / NBRC 107835 / XIL07) TaxID=446471 RepID=D1BY72_XYLCX|nr:ABC transporter permease [Xylanimonas cellulosilytica]ACZ29915.1 Monosaccharide-transporting ATPase [Xylanimonas cellulosilytica DSM 15894]